MDGFQTGSVSGVCGEYRRGLRGWRRCRIFHAGSFIRSIRYKMCFHENLKRSWQVKVKLLYRVVLDDL